ncbi:hypothetical protein MTE01_27670 [Microbacterium testaceum]|uniref:Uncharacterized protein n=1 Tax=Microbacterium testaceum TaxID=2033 RepID=A0A4Y3QNW9_MICTE|nr:hypothetical protein [Microbacterium testaceum]GEB46822.1 hypothetical protein MTE01_27670 [Microbacterium testaceum]
MTARINEHGWTPLDGALPETLDADKIYVIPTRAAGQTAEGAKPELYYTDNVRYLPKAARAQGLPLEFSQPEGERHYLQEFSIDPEMWSLGLAMLTIASDWLILAVSLFISQRADNQGWTNEEAHELPLRVYVAETETGRDIELEGSGTDVIEALKVLQAEAKKREQGESRD